MRIVKRSLGLLVLAVALFAVTASAASAANPEFLDGTVTGLTFTVKSGEGVLEDTATKLAIKCEKDTVSLANGLVTGPKTIEITVDFENCTVAGLAENSLGDAAKTVLVALKGELCYISKAEKHVGILFTLTPVHVEVPTLGELLELKGTMLGLVKGVNKLEVGNTITFNSTTASEKCEGGTADQLSIEKAHNGKPLAATETTTEEVTFDKDIEVDA